MASLSLWPTIVPPPSLRATGRSNSVSTIQSPQSPTGTPTHDYFPDSLSSNKAIPATTTIPEMPSMERRNSALSATQKDARPLTSATIRTRSLGFGAGVTFERAFQEPTDDDIIIVTIKLRKKFRKSSVDGAEDLPNRPTPRSFLRRLSTRMSASLDHSAEREERYKAMKMPRGDYKRYFQRDKDGNYAGSEPERDWEESELVREFGQYQEMPLQITNC